jgi:hypothetical protein
VILDLKTRDAVSALTTTIEQVEYEHRRLLRDMQSALSIAQEKITVQSEALDRKNDEIRTLRDRLNEQWRQTDRVNHVACQAVLALIDLEAAGKKAAGAALDELEKP